MKTWQDLHVIILHSDAMGMSGIKTVASKKTCNRPQIPIWPQNTDGSKTPTGESPLLGQAPENLIDKITGDLKLL